MIRFFFILFTISSLVFAIIWVITDTPTWEPKASVFSGLAAVTALFTGGSASTPRKTLINWFGKSNKINSKSSHDSFLGNFWGENNEIDSN